MRANRAAAATPVGSGGPELKQRPHTTLGAAATTAAAREPIFGHSRPREANPPFVCLLSWREGDGDQREKGEWCNGRRLVAAL
mmetsp:Transcript_6512/g.19255  ORF Transcript_6512/g.19255 Transcript_6512/m.19255 type:complete len:83 (-) Transcript_6512:154-402(-)